VNKHAVTLSKADMLVLDQNQPNPFNEKTIITYNVPEKYGYAQIIFTTTEGKIIKIADITQKGAGELTVYANDLSAGIYQYSLVVDGKTIETKKMIKQ
ncbi:MAG: T9SS type A sorting domain-containing protein, partial [Bacteroidota bacterium]